MLLRQTQIVGSSLQSEGSGLLLIPCLLQSSGYQGCAQQRDRFLARLAGGRDARPVLLTYEMAVALSINSFMANHPVIRSKQLM